MALHSVWREPVTSCRRSDRNRARAAASFGNLHVDHDERGSLMSQRSRVRRRRRSPAALLASVVTVCLPAALVATPTATATHSTAAGVTTDAPGDVVDRDVTELQEMLDEGA